jgi:hypothetical protein
MLSPLLLLSWNLVYMVRSNPSLYNHRCRCPKDSFLMAVANIGVYVTILLPTTWLIWHTRRDTLSKRALQLVGVTFCILFFLATTHIVLSLVMLFTNLVDPTNLTDTCQYITDADHSLNTASTCIWMCMVVVADVLVVWFS